VIKSLIAMAATTLVLVSVSHAGTVGELSSRELRSIYWDCDFIAAISPDFLAPEELLMCLAVYTRLIVTEFDDNFDRFMLWRRRELPFEFDLRVRLLEEEAELSRSKTHNQKI
jgi:hypothetical protein